MKVRFGVGLGAETALDELDGVIDRPGEFRGRLGVVLRTGLHPGGGSVRRHGLRAGPHPAVEGRDLGSDPAGTPSGSGGQTTGLSGGAGAQAGTARVRSAFGAARRAGHLRGARRPPGRGLRRIAAPACDRPCAATMCHSRASTSPSAPHRCSRYRPTPIDIWLGGSAPAALTRIGNTRRRVAGQLPHPRRGGAARRRIEIAAVAAGRPIEPDHYGISLRRRGRHPPRPICSPRSVAAGPTSTSATRSPPTGRPAPPTRRLLGRRPDQVR